MKTYAIFFFTTFLAVSIGFFSDGCSHKNNVVLHEILPPVVSSMIPGNPAAIVATNRIVTATFSNEMNPDTISIDTFSLTEGTTPVSGEVSYVGGAAVFTPEVAFAQNTTYVAKITNKVKNISGIKMKDSFAWNFTTGSESDTIVPTVDFTTPLDLTTDVPCNRSIGVTFSEAMNPVSINTSNFTLKKEGVLVLGNVKYCGNIAIFEPSENLESDAVYTAEVTNGVKDFANNSIDSNFIWSFMTGSEIDNSEPTVLLTEPANAAFGVMFNSKIIVTFSETMNPISFTTENFKVYRSDGVVVAGTVFAGPSINTAVFTPLSNLSDNTTYCVTINNGIKDLSGNQLSSSHSWVFTSHARNYTSWIDQGIIYSDPTGDAYYPNVLYESNGFDDPDVKYSMWYSDGYGSVYNVTSFNGTSWSVPITINGLTGKAHHVKVIYDEQRFGLGDSGPKYKIWYWDIDALSESISSIASALSDDGINWHRVAVLSQDNNSRLVSGTGISWNRGSCGPIHLFYISEALNSGKNPWNYSYIMYYGGTDGGREEIGLAFSSDGIFWNAYEANPVLSISASPSWDANYTTFGTVTRDDIGYHFWYSGGLKASSEGIGYAFSQDGKNWKKNSDYIFHINDPVKYRKGQVSTPAIIDDDSGLLKMYYTAKAKVGVRKIGLAILTK